MWQDGKIPSERIHPLEAALTGCGTKGWDVTSLGPLGSSEHFLGLLSQGTLRDGQRFLAEPDQR